MSPSGQNTEPSSHADFRPLQLAANPLAERILSSMDEDMSDTVDFEEFVRALAVFGPRSNPEEKLSCKCSVLILCISYSDRSS